MNLDEAFWQVCADAEVPKRAYVSLYRVDSWYGGPEEGGWWGETVTLAGFMLCNTEQEARDRATAVEAHAEQLTREAREAYGRLCLQQCETAWDRGVEPDDLYGEVDGPETYYVTVEDRAGSQTFQTPRGYC